MVIGTWNDDIRVSLIEYKHEKNTKFIGTVRHFKV